MTFYDRDQRTLVVVPATPDGLHPTVLPALLRADAEVLVLPMLHEDSYFQAVRTLWPQCGAEHVDLCIVEHDIEVGPDTLERFYRCRNLWCAHSYEVYWGNIARLYGGAWGMGCVRYRWQLMARWPDAVEQAGEMDLEVLGVGHHPRYSWQVFDSTLSHWLKGALGGAMTPPLKVCEHHPPVTHHHAYNREGAYAPGILEEVTP